MNITYEYSGELPVEVDFSQDPLLVAMAKLVNKTIKSMVTGNRAHNLAHSDDISLAGHAAEIAFILLTTHDKKAMLQKWSAGVTSGRNYGQDVLASYFTPALNRDIEVKSTPTEFDAVRGILFMRCPSGTCKKGDRNQPRSFWEAHLPDSYYCLLSQPDKQNKFRFRFRGWATKRMFFEHFSENNQLRSIIDPAEIGYPPICLHHSKLHSPESFQDIVR